MSDKEKEEIGKIISKLALGPRRKKKDRPEMTGIRNMDDLEKLCYHTYFNELRVCPEECYILLSEPILQTPETREKLTQLYFENMMARKLMIVPQEFLVMIAAGRSSAVVVNMGHTYTSIVPIWEMNILRDKVDILPLGGEDVTACLQYMLQGKEGLPGKDMKFGLVDDIKVNLAYVALDYEAEIEKGKAAAYKMYELPDGQVLELDLERFVCTECLFNPALIGVNEIGLGDRLRAVIDSLEGRTKEILGSEGGIVLAGASSMFPGIKERLQKELPGVKIAAAPERKSHAWVGGSIWGELSNQSIRSMWTSLAEYDEYGPSIIHSKCL